MHAGTCAQVRAILDGAGAQHVKVIPCKDDMLYERMGLIIGLPEPDWAAPRPPSHSRGGDWGAQRTILFSGMKCALGLSCMLRAQPGARSTIGVDSSRRALIPQARGVSSVSCSNGPRHQRRRGPLLPHPAGWSRRPRWWSCWRRRGCRRCAPRWPRRTMRTRSWASCWQRPCRCACAGATSDRCLPV